MDWLTLYREKSPTVQSSPSIAYALAMALRCHVKADCGVTNSYSDVLNTLLAAVRCSDKDGDRVSEHSEAAQHDEGQRGETTGA